jgi:hypothetical protein
MERLARLRHLAQLAAASAMLSGCDPGGALTPAAGPGTKDCVGAPDEPEDVALEEDGSYPPPEDDDDPTALDMDELSDEIEDLADQLDDGDLEATDDVESYLSDRQSELDGLATDADSDPAFCADQSADATSRHMAEAVQRFRGMILLAQMVDLPLDDGQTAQLAALHDTLDQMAAQLNSVSGFWQGYAFSPADLVRRDRLLRLLAFVLPADRPFERTAIFSALGMQRGSAGLGGVGSAEFNLLIYPYKLTAYLTRLRETVFLSTPADLVFIELLVEFAGFFNLAQVADKLDHPGIWSGPSQGGALRQLLTDKLVSRPTSATGRALWQSLWVRPTWEQLGLTDDSIADAMGHWFYDREDSLVWNLVPIVTAFNMVDSLVTLVEGQTRSGQPIDTAAAAARFGLNLIAVVLDIYAVGELAQAARVAELESRVAAAATLEGEALVAELSAVESELLDILGNLAGPVGPAPPLSADVAQKILYGEQKLYTQSGSPRLVNEITGAHSPRVLSDTNFVVVEQGTPYADGTVFVKLRKYLGRSWGFSKLKPSTLAPATWTDEDILAATRVAADQPAVVSRLPERQTLHIGEYKGIGWQTMRNADGAIEAGYPTSGKSLPTLIREFVGNR